MPSLSPVEPLGVQYETCEVLNAFVALEIAKADNSLPRLLQSFRSAARELCERSSHPLLEELAIGPLGCRASKRALQLAAYEEGVIEDLCSTYFAHAAKRKLVDLERYEPAAMAHSVLWALWEEEDWSTDCTLFRHSWRIENNYKSQGWHLLCPWIFAFGSQFPNLRQLQNLDAALAKIVETRGSTRATALLERADIAVTDLNVDLLWFLCCNRADVSITGTGANAQIAATEGVIPEIGLLSELASVEGWVRNPCRRWAFRLGQPQSILADTGAIESFLSRHGNSSADVSSAEIALKVALRQLAAEDTEQGLPKNVRRVLIDMLEREQRVISVTDLRRTLGVPHLKVDPFEVGPGRVLVYAPSEKFLDPNRTVFVLREWVQDSVRQRARIAPDRILTPLSPVTWNATEQDLLRAVRETRSFELFGIAFWDDVKKALQLHVPGQARRWAEHNLLQRAQKVLRGHGLVVADRVFFSYFRWQDLPASKAALRRAAHTLQTSQEWSERRAYYESEMVGVLERLRS